MQIDTRNRFNTTSHYTKYYPEDGSETFAPGVDYKIVLDLSKLGGTDYVGTYPVTLKSIKFNINRNSEAGSQTLALRSFYCHYPRTGIEKPEGDVNNDGEVTIADVNAIIDTILMDAAFADADVNHDGEVNIADINTVINLILTH